ncbi:hypothetical protein [Actinoplanes sp. NPDC049316]|uniref:hypothetical protein n=1 Tax=Actinoplanes sp. NPDC049316 TaxID=3154727 RepID=UPI0034496ED2
MDGSVGLPSTELVRAITYGGSMYSVIHRIGRTGHWVAIGVAVTAAAVAGPLIAGQIASAAEEDSPPSLVEDYSYPGAANITEIKLIRGDGHLMMVTCGTDQNVIRVRRNDITPGISGMYCFKVLGTNGGWLQLEIPNSFAVRGGDQNAVEATVSIEGVPQEPVHVAEGDWESVGVGVEGGKPAVLLELRAQP